MTDQWAAEHIPPDGDWFIIAGRTWLRAYSDGRWWIELSPGRWRPAVATIPQPGTTQPLHWGTAASGPHPCSQCHLDTEMPGNLCWYCQQLAQLTPTKSPFAADPHPALQVWAELRNAFQALPVATRAIILTACMFLTLIMVTGAIH